MEQLDPQRPAAEYTGRLAAMQLDNGSWAYRRGDQVGFAEPTCYALLALRAAGVKPARGEAALDWLEGLKRSSGGYAPQPVVRFANWTTSLVVLAYLHYGREKEAQPGIEWLLGLAGRESDWLGRTLRRLVGQKAPYPQDHEGWPWTRGAAAWLAPTVLATLALRRAEALQPGSKLRERIAQGEGMVLERRCADGGWNYGAPLALDIEQRSYPETTGMALVCLQGVNAARIPGADDLAVSLLGQRLPAATVSWLQLGLASRGVLVPDREEKAIECRTTLDLALRVLALRAMEGNNIFKA